MTTLLYIWGLPLLCCLALFEGCAPSEKGADYQIQQTSFNQTALGTKRAGAVGAIVQFDGDNATIDLNQLIKQVKIVARRQASTRERAVAKRRATIAYQRLAPRTKLAMKQKGVRYLAVETERTAGSRGRKSVMVWDTYAAEIVGNDVYDIAETPRLGEYLRFETYAANYVGTGMDSDATPTPLPFIAEGPGR